MTEVVTRRMAIRLLIVLVCVLYAVHAHGPMDIPLELLAGQDVVWPTIPDNPVVARDFAYSVNGAPFLGYAAWPDASDASNLPGVLIAPSYMGIGPTEQFRAREMASYGYVAFAMDIYGKGKNPNNTQQASQMSAQLRGNVVEFLRRSNTAMDVLKSLGDGPSVNPKWLFANGYCFGGGVVFELARTNYPGLVFVSGFHPSLGNLTYSPTPIAATVAAHRESLATVNDPQFAAFQTEMNVRKARWTAIKYSGCAHGWTDPRSTIYKPFEAAEAHMRMQADYLVLLNSAGGALPYNFDGSASSLTSREKGLIAATVIFGVLTILFAVLWRKASNAQTAGTEPLVNST